MYNNLLAIVLSHRSLCWNRHCQCPSQILPSFQREKSTKSITSRIYMLNFKILVKNGGHRSGSNILETKRIIPGTLNWLGYIFYEYFSNLLTLKPLYNLCFVLFSGGGKTWNHLPLKKCIFEICFLSSFFQLKGTDRGNPTFITVTGEGVLICPHTHLQW